MINIDPVDIKQKIKDSPNYKVVQFQEWIFVFEDGLDNHYDLHLNDRTDWERFSIIAISPEGRVVKNRYGRSAPTSPVQEANAYAGAIDRITSH